MKVDRNRLSLAKRFCILAILSTAVFLLCLANGHTNSLSPGLALKDPDDAMRLVQVIDLLDGKSRYHLTHHRVNPAAGVSMH